MSSNPIILIVEDTPDFARMTQLTLQRFGYDSYHVIDGEEAVAFLDEGAPDVILMDLNLPGMSGWQVLEYLHHLYGEGNVPVIVTSAYSDTANRTMGKLQGIYKYLIKPFSPQDLIEAVDSALGRT